MINFDQAKTVALNKLKEIETKSNIKVALLEADSISFEYGWVFFYQSEEFVRTGDESKLVGGNAPILVDKFNNIVLHTGTSKPTENYIEIYCRFKKDWLS